MMDEQMLNGLLHSAHFIKHYQVKAGDDLRIQLPSIPLTKYTEFLNLEKSLAGDLHCFVEAPEPSQDGVLLPREVRGKAVCPGEIRIILQAVNRLSGEKIPGVQPLEIVIKVEAN